MAKFFVYVDITDIRYLILALERGEKMEIKKISRPAARRRLNILVRLEKFLAEKKLTLKKISGLTLIEGAGSFSEVRLAAAGLNALHLDFGLPVFGLDKRAVGNGWPAIRLAARRGLAEARGPITPIYSGEPNITIPKL